MKNKRMLIAADANKHEAPAWTREERGWGGAAVALAGLAGVLAVLASYL